MLLMFFFPIIGKEMNHVANNHYHMSFINQELTKRGYETWFDEDEMAGNIAERMSEGIQQTKVVAIFLTRKLFLLHKTTARILVVVMEECMRA